MLLDPRVATFVQWFGEYQTSVVDLAESMLLPTSPRRARLIAADGEAVEIDADEPISDPKDGNWGHWLDECVRPDLLDMLVALRRSIASLHEGTKLQRLSEELEAAVDELPELLTNGGGPDQSDASRSTVGSVPLRRWMELAFLDEVRLAEHALHEALVRAVEAALEHVAEFEKVLDYYVLAVRRHTAEVMDPTQGEEFARAGLARVHALVLDLRLRHRSAARLVTDAYVRHTADALEDACAPLRAHRAAEIERRLGELERRAIAGPPPPRPMVRLADLATSTYHRALPIANELTTELRALFADQQPEAMRFEYLRLLRGESHGSSPALPKSYSRLFATIPIEIADMYVPRTSPERECTTAITAWRTGLPHSIVLHGDRGAGKRTIANHLLPRVGTRVNVAWVRLGPEAADESYVAATLGRALEVDGVVDHFAGLSERLPRTGRKHAIVVENAERLLSPTPRGVARMASFLRLVGDSAETTLWILLMATPAAILALHRLEFASRIPTIVEVQPMGVGELRDLMLRRHRRSGFDLEFAEPSVHVLERVRRPLSSVRVLRDPSGTFFTRLHALSGGNPRQAMYYWLGSARLDPSKEGRIVMQALPEKPVELLRPLDLPKRLVLSLLTQHASMTAVDLQSALSVSPEQVVGDLKVLWATGYISPLQEHAGHWTLQPAMAHPLLLELRAANMV